MTIRGDGKWQPYNTNGTTNPYMWVDLGSPQAITQIRFWMATGGATIPNAVSVLNTGVTIWVSNTTVPPSPWVAGPGFVAFPDPYINPNYNPNILTTPVPIVGRYVWAVQIGNQKVLQLCQLQVFQPLKWTWRQLSGQVNLATNKVATMSTVSSGFTYGDPLNLIDGATGSTARTPNPISNPWIMVDLGATYQIDRITILDGAGSNWGRNNATEIIVSDSSDPFSTSNAPCFGPAPITCYSYSTVLSANGNALGDTAGHGADGYYNSNLCTSSNGPITINACNGAGRYIFIRKRDKYAAFPNGMWYPAMNAFDQCKFSAMSAYFIAPYITPDASGRTACGTCPQAALAGAAAAGQVNCGACGYLAAGTAGAIPSTTLTATTCFVSTGCTPAPCICSQWGGESLTDASMLVIGELYVYGNLQRYEPVARAGAATAVFGSRMVIFGGIDGKGYLLNDLRTFDTVPMQWEAPLQPLGTAPPARAWASMALLPSGVAGQLYTSNAVPPASAFLLFGGQGAASTYSDTATLSTTPCPALSGLGVTSATCALGGTRCTYSCMPGFTASNLLAFCNPDGTWNALLPLCAPAVGLVEAPPFSVATPVVSGLASQTAAQLNFSWQRPATTGYGDPTGPTSYTIMAAPEVWMQRFVGQPLDTSWVPNTGLPPNSLVSNYVNVDVDGYVQLSTNPLGMCTLRQQDCNIVARPFPTGGNLPNLATQAWTLEAEVSFKVNTADVPIALNQIGIGIFDSTAPVTVLNPLYSNATFMNISGGLHFFTGLKATLAMTWSGGWEAMQSAAYPPAYPQALYSLSTQISRGQYMFNPGYYGSASGFFRIDRWPNELVQDGVNVSRAGYGSWRIGWKYHPAWPVSYSPWLSDAQMLRPNAAGQQTFNAATAMIALVGVSGSTTRSVGQVRSVRFGAFLPDPPGPVLQVPATTTAVLTSTQKLQTGAFYAPGSSNAFVVASAGQLGQGAFGSPTPAVSIPFPPTSAWNSAALIEVAQGKPTGGVNASGVLPTGGSAAANYASSVGNNGNLAQMLSAPLAGPFVYMQSSQWGGPSWWYVDLGIPTAVKEVVLYNRLDTLQSTMNNFQVLLTPLLYQGGQGFTAPGFGGPPLGGTLCNPQQVPTSVPLSATYTAPTYLLGNANAVLSAQAGQAYSAAARFNCSWPTGVVGRYLYVVGGFASSSTTGQPISFRQVQVFATNSCPARSATNALQVPGSNCAAGAPYGAVCAHQCLPGYFEQSGVDTTTCNGDSWNAPQLVCAPQCQPLSAPQYAFACTQTLYADNFTNPLAVPSSWISIMENFPSLGQYVFGVNGALQINVAVGAAPLGIVAVTTNEPVMTWVGAFSVSVIVSTNDAAGVAWYAQDQQNFYRAVLDVTGNLFRIERMYLGALVTLASSSSPTPLVAFVPVTLKVVVDQADEFFLYANNVLVLSTSDNYMQQGPAGVAAASYAQFNSFSYSTSCSSCQGASAGGTCMFQCASGLVAAGVADVAGGPYGTRTCVNAGPGAAAWSPPLAAGGGVDMTCTLAAPYFPPATLTVPELSPANTYVGNPLVATITSPDYTVLFAITGGANNSAFYVDSCSGQVKVRSGAVLDFLAMPQYVLQVSASVSEFPLSITTTSITINVLEVDVAPAVTTAAAFSGGSVAPAVIAPTAISLPENAPAGFLVGTVPYYDANLDNATFAMIVDGSSGRFTLQPNGNIVVSAGLPVNAIDFEQPTTWPFSLSVKATESTAKRAPCSGATCLSGAGQVLVSLTDVDDPPVVPAGLQIWTGETAMNTVGGALTTGNVTASDQDNAVSGAFASPLVYSLLPPSRYANVSACRSAMSGNPPYSFPTVDGTAAGAPLFSIDSASGQLTTLASPSAGISSNTAFPPFGYQGVATRIIYVLCVNVSEANFGGPTSFGAGPVLVPVQATLVALPVALAVTPAVLPTTGGLVTITGTTFSPGVPTKVWAVDSYGSGRQLNLTGCVAASNASMSCTMPPASGALYNLFVAQAITGGAYTNAAQPTQLTIGFQKPTVTAITGNTGLKTATGGVLNLTGTNFSPLSAADGVTLLFGLVSPYAGPLACAINVTASSHTRLVCTMPPYFSSGWGWTLTVGGQTVSVSAGQSVSYEAPTVTALAAMQGTCPGASCVPGNFSTAQLDTMGGQVLRINGTGLGNSDALLTVLGTYGAAAIPFSTCKHEAAGAGLGPNFVIYCTTSPGVGNNLPVTIVVGNQNAAGALSIAYAPPTLSSVTSSGPMPTVGGSVITIVGKNFGPAGVANPVTAFSYGPAPTGAQYPSAVSSCTVTTAATTITCVGPPGVGKALSAVISIGGQSSAVFSAGLAYAAPSVYTFSGLGAALAATTGSQQVIVSGANFGPADPYTNSLLSVTYGMPLQRGPGNLTKVIFTAVCSITAPGHTSMSCTTAPGVGGALSWTIAVAGQTSVQPTTNYAPPLITGVALQTSGGVAIPAATGASVNGGTVAVLTGQFFGPTTYNNNGNLTALIQSVSFGVTGTSYSVSLFSVTAVSQTQINVRLPAGAGTGLGFIVNIGDQTSPLSTATFSYAQPSILRLSPSTGSTYNNPQKPTVVTAAALNLPLRDPQSIISLNFGNGPAQVAILPSLPLSFAAQNAARNNDSSTNITFTLPQDGAGVQLAVQLVVTSASTGSVVASSTVGPASTFSYNPPAIASVIVTRARFAGSGAAGAGLIACPFPAGSSAFFSQANCNSSTLMQITVQGSNFGLAAVANGQPLPAAQQADNVAKDLSFLLTNYTSVGGVCGVSACSIYGEVWCSVSCTQSANSAPLTALTTPPLPTTQLVWVQSWTHTQIVAYAATTAATLRVQLTSTTYQALPATQQVTMSFLHASPEITAISGVYYGIPTTGGSASSPVTLSVLNLAPGDGIGVFVGDSSASLPCSCGGFTGVASAGNGNNCVTDLVSRQLAALPQGSPVSVCFVVPMGQGSAAPIVLSRTELGAVDYSNNNFVVTYLSPSLASIATSSDGGATWSSPIDAQLYGAAVTVPTDGSALMRLSGSNLGNAPAIFMGDWHVLLAPPATAHPPAHSP